MLINVATRKFARSVRLPARDLPASAGAGLSKSAASRRFVALSAARLKEWMTSDLSGLDLLVIQIDGIHMDDDLILVAALGVDAKGDKHPLSLAEGATENAATVQALIDNLAPMLHWCFFAIGVGVQRPGKAHSYFSAISFAEMVPRPENRMKLDAKRREKDNDRFLRYRIRA